MSTIIDLLGNLWKLLACIGELLGHLLRFVRAFFQTRASLAARLVAAESQRGICKRRIEQKGTSRFRFTAGLLAHQVDLHVDPGRTAPSVPASGGVAVGGLGHSALGRLDQSALPPACPSLQGHIWPQTIKLQLWNLPTLLANAGPIRAVRLIPKSQMGFFGGTGAVQAPICQSA